MPLSNFLKSASNLLAKTDLLTAPDEAAAFGTDWTKLPGNPCGVAFPRSATQLAELLKLCAKEKVAVVPSGGRTGLAGGAVAAKGELVLSLAKLTRLEPVDVVSRTVRVGAGVTTQAVHEHAEKHGLTWPIDLAAKGSSTIGGNLSTNAGGLRVVRYGMARKWVTALQAVTMGGEILEINHGLEKNNTGYDLLQLLVGSEGTLAVITEATLKLTRLPKSPSVLFFGVDSAKHALEIFENARGGPFEVLACEFFSDLCLKAVTAKLGRKTRFGESYPFYLLIEIEAGLAGGVTEWLEKVLESGLVKDGMVATSADEIHAVWGLREGITESLAATAPVRKYDVAVPVKKVAEVLEAVQALSARLKPCFDLYLFGHLGDGSPHFNLLKHPAASPEQFKADGDKFEKELYPLMKEFHGSVSAEHGVGLLKKNWVAFSRSPEEMRLFKAIKAAFDPEGLLNPGKVLDRA